MSNHTKRYPDLVKTKGGILSFPLFHTFSIRKAWLFLSAFALVGAITFVAVGAPSPVSQTFKRIDLSTDPLFAAAGGDKPAITLALSVEFPTVGAQYVASPGPILTRLIQIQMNILDITTLKAAITIITPLPKHPHREKLRPITSDSTERGQLSTACAQMLLAAIS
jgi:hypothetical protein